MLELTAHYIAHSIIGEADGRDAPHTADLYLLSRTGRVIAQRTALDTDLVGKHFFECFPAEAAERDTFDAEGTTGVAQTNLLLLCRNMPALLCRGACRQVGMLPVAVPVGKAAKVLSYPAVFGGVLRGLSLSPAAARRHRPHEGEVFATGSRWYAPFAKAFYAGHEYHSGELLFQTLAIRSTYLALLCGCRLEYDFRTAHAMYGFHADPDTYTGILFCVLMAVQRMRAEQTVSIYLDRDNSAREFLHIRFYRDEQSDPVPELWEAERTAHLRGMTFHRISPMENPLEVQICASLTPTELEAQGLKQNDARCQGPLRMDLSPKQIFFTPEQIREFLGTEPSTEK